MRLLFIGDVIGRAGRNAISEHVPVLRNKLKLDFVVANGENAAGGFGLTEHIAHDFLNAGVDCVTLGNHSFDQREALVFIERAPHVLRPINYPPGTPGKGAWLYETKAGARVLVVSVLGRVFMDAMDDPFAALERELSACPLGQAADAIIVDLHAEASSEKQALGNFVDGRVSLAVGTHTHVPTADWRILPHGTAFQSDAGMTGDYDSVIGMDKDEPIRRFIRKTPGSRFEPADGPATLCGLFVETGADGLAKRVEPVRVGGLLAQALPDV
ncbi:metallophosphoesterase (TIGR00282 family) [Rhodoblastus acidophilus]|uniref:TIGR00282 family metallophosphoesterase n=1 Tax=Rhodoblastus acidophilus TaxID=1074 RepID=UPI00222418CB|nr:TIGR00282 family metallophosphoesterase [Rhodoblastus acidophilus]MCW2284790.1 metallophosphoesterase (TIGR00282 family) [Rhodoblastus acidophilus]MCW2333743.1 metallophosphoesterase (TIGR00282 family) [Rhodoblastus acidophilus]